MNLTHAMGGAVAFRPQIQKRPIAVEELVVDLRLQARAGLNPAVVRDFAATMLKGTVFPPLLVVTINGKHYVVDGFHRLEAAKRAKCKELEVEVFEGTRRQALKVALGANTTHGCRRTNADKRNAVSLALKEFGDRSDKVLADMCGVADRFVAKLRNGMGANSSPHVRTGRDGKPHTVRSVPNRAKSLRADTVASEPPLNYPMVPANSSGPVSTLQTANISPPVSLIKEQGNLSNMAKTVGSPIAPTQHRSVEDPANLVRAYISNMLRHYPAARGTIMTVLRECLAEVPAGSTAALSQEES